MKQVISIILCLTFIFIPFSALSQELPERPTSKITNLKKGQEAPFAGILLDPWAMAEITARMKYDQDRFELRLDYLGKKKDAEASLQVDSLKVSLESLRLEYRKVTQLKDREIIHLRAMAADHKDYSSLWFTGGIIVGIISTVLVVWIVGEVFGSTLFSTSDFNVDLQ